MSPLAIFALAFGWLLVGLLGGSWIARSNQARGTRRVPALERHAGWLYLTAALLGPAAPALGVVMRAVLRRGDLADERRAVLKRAERLAARRAARKATQDRGATAE